MRGEEPLKMNELLARIRRANVLRIAVCLMSLGFVFPNALMENADAARLAEEQLGRKDSPPKP
jgi:hypothetical protein